MTIKNLKIKLKDYCFKGCEICYESINNESGWCRDCGEYSGNYDLYHIPGLNYTVTLDEIIECDELLNTVNKLDS